MRRCSVITTGTIETDHIAALEGLQGTVTVDRRCADLAELTAAAESMRADAALIIGSTTALTASLIERLQAAELRVVVVSDVKEERRRLASLGVAAHPDDVEVTRLAEALMGSPALPVPPDSPSEEVPPETGSRSFSEGLDASGGSDELSPWSTDTQVPAFESEEISAAGISAADIAEEAEHEELSSGDGDEASAEAEEGPSPQKGVTVVWGAHGSPGRTTVAVNMAAELAGAGYRVLLIDADTTASGVVTHLGLLEESAGLAQACRQADLGRLDAARLRRASTVAEVRGSRMHLLTGLPRASRWPELRSRALREVLQLARNEYPYVIVDVSASVEQDEELTYDTAAPQRHAATVCALQEADRLLALGTCDPVGFPRLVKALEDIRHEVPEAPAAAALITKVRRGVVGRSPQEQLRSTWRRFGPEGGDPAFLPWDVESCDAALLKGQTLAEAAPDSELRRGIAALAGVDVRTRRRRRLSLRKRESALG
ncbi:CpaE family protein [Nesterenkonia lacusekhoensis]|uniref:Mrp family chromosome partitioning ATPase n=1 Tax=Nesterenkonia lacusekhoensis TaxID=150832 RepID=A0ABS4T2F5_9MICC|nr:ParA family protein [Nesterenkonia lacusekhoensis]MBP2318630.1 Mrp family chromosome partitioning ATPase [Nesterenkonia lacusekhoensis]